MPVSYDGLFLHLAANRWRNRATNGIIGIESMAGPDRDSEEAVITKAKRKVERPKLYKVLLHNDDYTTREFVVSILRLVFQRSDSEAVQIMLHVHNNGIGVAGVYPFEVAEAKIQRTTTLAEEYEFPLLTTMEPE
jgi:ATP-dependent Clp protease adaptor protein ClpS